MIVFIKKFILYLKAFFSELLPNSQVVKMSAYYNLDGSLQKLNWGDDINYWFLREIVDGRIISYDWSLLTRHTSRHYIMGIGSLLTIVPLDNSIIWGSGVMSSTDGFSGNPKEVRAVRGPLTRNRLLEAGIVCPEVYGDPALLLPKYYSPKVEKKYRVGIIPHYKDQKSPIMLKFQNNKDVLIIDIRNYNNWLDFIDQINQCDAILSTSLHGLIVSEAYGVPNVWIKLHDSERDDDIKYHDFFLSIGKDREPYVLDENVSMKELFIQVSNYSKGYIDLTPLVNACPLHLKKGIQIERRRNS